MDGLDPLIGWPVRLALTKLFLEATCLAVTSIRRFPILSDKHQKTGVLGNIGMAKYLRNALRY